MPVGWLGTRETHCHCDSMGVGALLAPLSSAAGMRERSLHFVRVLIASLEREQFSTVSVRLLLLKPVPDAALAYIDPVADPGSIGRKRDPVYLVASLVRRNPVGVARETWVTVPCPTRAEGQTQLRPLLRGSRRTHLLGQRQAFSPALRDPSFAILLHFSLFIPHVFQHPCLAS